MQQYLDYIFASPANFEKVVFEIQSDDERREIIQLIAKQIIREENIRKKVNFQYLSSLNHLDLSELAHTVVRLLLSEAIEWLVQYFPDEELIRRTIQEDKMKIYMLHEMGLAYYDKHEDIFISEIVETFFELIGQAETFKHVAKIGHDAVNGTPQVKSLFILDDGAPMVRKIDQVWMRVDQANKAKKRKIFTLEEELKKSKESVEDLKTRITAINKASQMTAAALKKYSPELVRDIFTEEDPKYVSQRRLLTALPAGDLCYQMEVLCERAAMQAKTGMAKEEFKKIQAVFAKAKINNTADALKLKRSESEQKLPFKIERYKEIAQRYEQVQDESLEAFDEQLERIKEALVLNLKKLPVKK